MLLTALIALSTPAAAQGFFPTHCTHYEAENYAVDGDPDTYQFADNLLVGESGSAVGSVGGFCYDVGTAERWKEAEWYDFVEVSTETVESEPARVFGDHTTRLEIDIYQWSYFAKADASVDYELEFSTDAGATWRPWFSASDDSAGLVRETLSDVHYYDHRRYITAPFGVDPSRVRVRATISGRHDICDDDPATDPEEWTDNASFSAKMNLSNLELVVCSLPF